MKYIVLEIQTNTNDTVGTIINTYDTRNAAEQQYHTTLAFASVSALPIHGAIMLTNEGQLIRHECYHHEIEPETPEEPTEPVEP